MQHEEHIRIVPGSDTAVLFIHGICGTPNHFREFVSRTPEEYSVYNMLLDGHGAGVRDFSRTSMAIWKQQVDSVVDRLCETHNRVLIVAHSMGTLFAVWQAVRRPEKVGGLFLLAVPLKLRIRPRVMMNSMKLAFGNIKPEDHLTNAVRDACGIAMDKRFWLYFGWIPRYLELFRLIRETRPLLPRLCTPCSAFQSGKDELVSRKSCRILAQAKSVCVTALEDSTHYYYDPADKATLQEAFKRFLS